MKFKFFIVALLSLTLISCNKESEQVIRPVETITIQKAPETISYEYPAIISAKKEGNLAFRVAGPIEKINVQVGAFVRKGDIIAELDKRDYELQLEAFKNKTLVAKNVYEASKAVAENARKQFARVEKLYKEKSIPKKSYDEALAFMKSSSSGELAGLAQYEEALKGLENCKNQLEDTNLKAPYDGYIQKKFADVGNVVGAGLPVFTISSIEDKKININVSERDLTLFENFIQAEFLKNSQSYPVELLDISRVKGSFNLSYPVTFKFADENSIPVDSEGVIKVTVKAPETVGTVIPPESLFEKDGKVYVWEYKDGVVNKKEVKIISTFDSSNLNISKIEEGTEIVTKGVHELSEGQKVNSVKPMSKTNIGNIL